MKRTLAFLLALIMTVTMLPMSVFAAEKPTFTVTSVGGGFTHTYNIKTNKPSRKACGVYSN